MAKIEDFLVQVSFSKVGAARGFLAAEGVTAFREEAEPGGDVTFHVPQTKQNLAAILKMPREYFRFKGVI